MTESLYILAIVSTNVSSEVLKVLFDSNGAEMLAAFALGMGKQVGGKLLSYIL